MTEDICPSTFGYDHDYDNKNKKSLTTTHFIIIGGCLLLFLIAFYFIYRFTTQASQKLKSMESALSNTIERTNQLQRVLQSPPPPPQMSCPLPPPPQPQHVFVSTQVPAPAPQVVVPQVAVQPEVISPIALDNELSEELNELKASTTTEAEPQEENETASEATTEEEQTLEKKKAKNASHVKNERKPVAKEGRI